VGVAVVQASLYDVPGGYRGQSLCQACLGIELDEESLAVMFDRFQGVKDKASLSICVLVETS
jgi:hypothetical protein